VCLCRKEALTLTTGGSSPSLVAGFSFFGREELSIEGFTVYTEPPQPSGKPLSHSPSTTIRNRDSARTCLRCKEATYRPLTDWRRLPRE
jgi:hypothetical protein